MRADLEGISYALLPLSGKHKLAPIPKLTFVGIVIHTP
jgi:hypothetical protein